MLWRMFFSLILTGSITSAAQDCDLNARTEITVLSNNVGIFPAFMHSFYPKHVKEKKSKIMADEAARAAALATAILNFEGDPDVVLLQEIWSLKARDVLIQDLSEKYPFYKHPPVLGVEPLATQQAGLMFFSKYALSDFQFKVFSKGIGVDKMSRKGIVGVCLTKEGRNIAVFNTHLQAGGRRDPTIKPTQLKECNALIQRYRDKDATLIPILCGDFNIDSSDPKAYASIFEHLSGARDSYKEVCSVLKKTGRQSKTPNKRIDYLFTFDGVEALSTIVDPAGETVSDHLTVFGSVSLDGEKEANLVSSEN